MVSIATAQSLLQPLLGRPIWGIRRSHGSFFIAQIGAVRDILTLPARQFDNGRVVPERHAPQGNWHLMVELCRWRIQVGERMTSDLDEDHAHMQAVMSALNGASICSLDVSADTLTLNFSNDGQMKLGPVGYVSPGETGSQWVIFLAEGGNLSRDTTGRMSRE